MNPGPGLPSVSPEPFEAAKEPEKLLSLIRTGRPCYLLQDYYYGADPTPEGIANLQRHFDGQPLASMPALNGKTTNVFLARLTPKGQPSAAR